MAGLSLMLSACGDDSGVPARIHEKTKRTPENIEASAMTTLESAGKLTSQQSQSNQAIRKDTLGLNVTIAQSPNTDDFTVTVNISYEVGANQCGIGLYTQTFTNSKIEDKNFFNVDGFGSFKCINTSCSYLLAIIEDSPSVTINVDGNPTKANVPVILTDKSNDGNKFAGEFIPTTSDDSTFLYLDGELNTRCTKPVQIEGLQNQRPVSEGPTDPDYSYFPDDTNNTWIPSY